MMSAITDRITVIGIVLDDLDALIDHTNHAFDIAHENNLPSEADELMMIKSEVWTLRKKLVKQIEILRVGDLGLIVEKGHHPC